MSSDESGNAGTKGPNYDRLQKDMDAAKNDISKLVEQITEALNTLAASAQRQASQSYTQAKSNLDVFASDIGRHGSAALGAAQNAAATLEETLEDAIQERPLAAVALALGLGFLIGVTWRR